MPQIVEYNGARIEFPDGMPPSEIEAAIKRNALSLPSKAASQVANDAITRGAKNFTDEMSTVDKFRAGIGKAFYDTARGLGQLIPGVESRADVAEARRLDAPLMNTTAGTAGNVLGNAGLLLGTALIPGANTLRGAAAIGAATGLAQPSVSTGETIKNTALGAVVAPATIAAVRGGQALVQAGKGLMEPLTRSGQERIAADVLQRSATNPANAVNAARNAGELVPGSKPTLAQVANDPGLAQLERTILNNPEYAGAIQQRQAGQKLARLNAVQDIAGRGDYYDDIVKGRAIFANEDYANALNQGIDPQMAKAMAPQIQSLMERPSIQAAQKDAIRLAKENGIALTDTNSLQGLDWLKKALDNQISKASSPASAIGDADLRALVQTKSDLMATIEQLSPAYKAANDSYAAMSRQVNSADVARSLLDKLNKPGSQYNQPGTAKEMGEAYQRSLAQSFDSVKKATGMNKDITQVMPAKDIRALEAVARDIGRKNFAESAGKATGSNTAQNLASQNMLRRMLGPTGLPETWAESTMLQGLLSPVQAASKLTGADKRIMDRIALGLLDPADGVSLLTAPAPVRNVGLLGAPAAQRYLPALGLLATHQRN
jgi:hypothetical protein